MWLDLVVTWSTSLFCLKGRWRSVRVCCQHLTEPLSSITFSTWHTFMLRSMYGSCCRNLRTTFKTVCQLLPVWLIWWRLRTVSTDVWSSVFLSVTLTPKLQFATALTVTVFLWCWHLIVRYMLSSSFFTAMSGRVDICFGSSQCVLLMLVVHVLLFLAISVWLLWFIPSLCCSFFFVIVFT